MLIRSVVEAQFSASHTVTGHPRCGERHGHTWRVRIETTTREEDLDAGALAGAITQYDHRDLDRFLPGVDTGATGLAVFFREALGDFPVTAIEVIDEDGVGGRVEWQVR